MSRQHNNSALTKLQREWYAKLEENDFKDIEQEDGNLKVWHSHLFKKNYNPIVAEARAEYYTLACQFLHEHKFESESDKLIWKFHSEGLSYRDTIKELKRLGHSAYMDLVKLKLKELKAKMLKRVAKQ